MAVFLGDYSTHGKRPSVEEQLAKHGSHNQASHGGKGGAKGSGGGGSAVERNEETRSKAVQQVSEAEKEMQAVDDQIQGDGETSRTKAQERSADITQESQEEITAAKDSLVEAKRAPSDRMYKQNIDKASKKLKDAGDRLVERAVNGAQAAVGKKLQAVSQTLQSVSADIGE